MVSGLRRHRSPIPPGGNGAAPSCVTPVLVLRAYQSVAKETTVTDLLAHWRALSHTPRAEMIRKALEPLVSLESAPDVAAWFREHHCTGVPGSSASCVIAEYLTARTGMAHIVVSGATVRDYDAAGRTLARIDLPAPLRSFARRFDQGEFSDLIKSGRG